MNPILGIDFGAARIGIAISDELQLLAHPLETIAGGKNAVARITEIVREKKIDKMVAGVPRNMDGSFGAAANKALQFVEKLRAVVSCQVVTWDERLTTVAAHRELREAGRKTRETRGYVDQVAAHMLMLPGRAYRRRVGRARLMHCCLRLFACFGAIMCQSVFMRAIPPKEKFIATKSGLRWCCRPLNTGESGT